MPTQTKFICPSGGANVDLSGIFEPLNGGTSYGSATKYRVGSTDLTGIFHASTGGDTPSFNTGFKVSGGADLSTIFRRYGYVSGPSITVQPTDQTVVQGNTLTFTITAVLSSGGGSLSYQWYSSTDNATYTSLGSSNGAQTNTYQKLNAQYSTDEKYYHCVVTDNNGSITSSNVYATINYPATINSNPSSGAVNVGNAAAFVVVINNGKPTTYSYQWQRSTDNGSTWSNLGASSETSISGYYTASTTSTTSTLSFISSNPSTNYSSQYRCVVTNSAGSVTSLAASLYINPNFTTNLSTTATATVLSGQTNVNQSFTIAAAGSPTLSYQWQRSTNGGSTYSNVGTDSPSYTESVTDTSTGYKYRCQVSSNAPGTTAATSAVCTLTVNLTALSFNSVTTGAVSVTEGNNITFTAATANGSGTLTYQWLVSTNGGVSYSNVGAAGQSYTLVGAGSTQNGYKYACQLSSSFSSLGTVNSSPATLTVYYLTITGGTVNNIDYLLSIGDTVNYTVTTSANPSVTSYSWKKNGSQVSTSSSYSFTVANITSAGLYSVDVSNTYVTKSTSSNLYVQPYIITQPSSTTVNSGTAASFTVSAEGSSKTYQWQINTGSGWNNVTNGTGGTSATYYTPTTTSSYNGYQYRCVISNTLNISGYPTINQTTNAVTLTVNYLPTYATFSPSAGGTYSAGNSLSVTHTGNDGNPAVTARQWYYWNGASFVAASGQTGTTYNIGSDPYDGTPDSMGGNVYRYYYTIRLTNSVGSTDPQDDTNFGWYVDVQF